MNNPFILGKKIYLRALERSDIPLCTRWINDPGTHPYIYTGTFPYNEERETKWFENLYNSNDRLELGICLTEGDTLIGTCGFIRIDWVHRWAIFGIILGESEYRDKGLGTEATLLMLKHAFDTLNLQRVELGVFSTNTMAIKCYTKAGFEIEGTLRSKTYKNGRYVDEIVMSVLKEKWEQNQ